MGENTSVFLLYVPFRGLWEAETTTQQTKLKLSQRKIMEKCTIYFNYLQYIELHKGFQNMGDNRTKWLFQSKITNHYSENKHLHSDLNTKVKVYRLPQLT